MKVLNLEVIDSENVGDKMERLSYRDLQLQFEQQGRSIYIDPEYRDEKILQADPPKKTLPPKLNVISLYNEGVSKEKIITVTGLSNTYINKIIKSLKS